MVGVPSPGHPPTVQGLSNREEIGVPPKRSEGEAQEAGRTSPLTQPQMIIEFEILFSFQPRFSHITFVHNTLSEMYITSHQYVSRISLQLKSTKLKPGHRYI